MSKELEGRDADLLYEHFVSKQEKNSIFSFAIKKCQEDHLTHYFWADVKSKRAYKYFGDVVVFDSTYNTNRYGIIFAPFIGVNNHGQTIILACSLISDETSNSFVWLLERFKKNMLGRPPKMIITDQDSAMTKAISQALLDTFHSKEKFDSTWKTIIGKVVLQHREELIADHVGINEKPMLNIPNLIEKQMAETYTH
ncbi:hypothetical protein Ddye_024004 [Dipteronia dyeriana]|uniref:MULE transposase domain-containing protein n=1 Tax=Dipteronia dyeriana TaxID=168575 RepID=A0AAD9WT61_9ROSI|nr:hypothetical protein Ddye_024004 [Dipteronia dyeriana]